METVVHEVTAQNKIQGIGTGFVPNVLNLDVVDEVVQMTNDELRS